jgi:VWFA-related protein
MMKLYLVVFPILLLAEIAGGQDGSSGQPTQTEPPEVVIKTSAREVLLDVVVRDAHGKLVTNLKPEEITVFEDGTRQSVRSFRLVAGSEVFAEDQKLDAQLPEGRPTATRNGAQPAVNPLRTVNLVCLILNDLDSHTRSIAFDSARQFVNNELRPNTFIGIFSLDSSGLRPVFPFSNNRERLLKAVELAAINQLPSLNVGTAAMLNGFGMSPLGAVTAGAGAAEGNADGSSVGDPLGTRGDMGFSVYAGLRELDALRGLIKQLSPLPFQKTVLLLSNGLTRPPDQLEYWDSTVKLANKGYVTFYAVDVHGLCQDALLCQQTPMDTSAAMLGMVAGISAKQSIPMPAVTPPGASPTAQLAERAHEDDFVKFLVSSGNRQEALRELAERTGGFLIANTNNIEKPLARVMEDVNTHYEIAYPPTSNIDDGHFRKIEVKLARAGLTVQTREGYFAVPETGEGPVTPEEMGELRALDTQPRPHDFDFLLRTYRYRSNEGTAQYAIAFEMPISNLTAVPEADAKHHQMHASLLALVKDAQGRIVDRVSKDVPSEVSDDHLAAVRVELMTYAKAVNLPPGHYTVEAAVVDQLGNRAGTGVTQIDNRQRPGLGMSDLTLVRRLETLDRAADAADPFEFSDKRVLPFVTTDLYVGGFPFLYLVVYPRKDNPAKAELRIQFLKEGRVVAAHRAALPPPDASGSIPEVLTGYSKPGSYEVRVTVVQGQESVERSLHYTIAAK